MDQYALTSDLVIGDKSLDPTGREGLQQFVFFSKFHTSIAIPLKIDATSEFSNLSTEVKAKPLSKGATAWSFKESARLEAGLYSPIVRAMRKNRGPGFFLT
jgi:hypothetical protein